MKAGKLTPVERRVLESFALRGNSYIFGIHQREDINATSARRSIIGLKLLKLIYLIEEGEGEKSRKTYGITPLGVLASVVQCGLWGFIGDVDAINPGVVPFFLRKFDQFVEVGLGEYVQRVALVVYGDVVGLVVGGGVDSRYPYRVIVERNSLDSHFFSVFVKEFNLVELGKIVDVINEDVEYVEVWRRWYSFQGFLSKFLEQIDSQIK